MYLNILNYIDDEKQNELMEMIGMTEKLEGIIAQIRNQGKEDAEKDGERKIIKKLLEKQTN